MCIVMSSLPIYYLRTDTSLFMPYRTVFQTSLCLLSGLVNCATLRSPKTKKQVYFYELLQLQRRVNRAYQKPPRTKSGLKRRPQKSGKHSHAHH